MPYDPTIPTIDPIVAGQLNTAAGRGVLRQADLQDGLDRRVAEMYSTIQAELVAGFVVDSRAEGAAIVDSMIGADDPQSFARLSTASHVPVPQPWMAPPWVQSGFQGTPAASQPGPIKT
jgi:hypothetical protein